MSVYGSSEQHGLGSSGGIGNGILSTIARNPEGLLLMLAGAALLMRTGRGTSQQEQVEYPSRGVASEYYRNTYAERERAGLGGFERARGQAEGVADQARAYAEATRERVAEYGEAARARAAQMSEEVARAAEAAGEYMLEATGRAAGAARSTADTLTEYADTARRRMTRAQSSVQEGFETMMRDQPLAIAAVGFVAGAALAALLPRTEAEEQALGPAREALAGTAYQAGENLREAASEAGETLRARAAERGLDVEGLKDLAGEVAGAFKSAVTGKEPQGSPSVVPENAEPMTGENR
ncbi:MAG: hypothetical protein NW215_03800 [Hyphomicrobiales bacterium]|nr:hypothetical protein [Hyphomicrobiales bacterium]